MAKPLFTPEELEQMRRDDELLDEEFRLTKEEEALSNARDGCLRPWTSSKIRKFTSRMEEIVNG